MGVPKAIDEWVNLYEKVVMSIIEDMVNSDDWEFHRFEHDGETKEAYGKQLTWSGKEAMELILKEAGMDLKTFINTDTFEGFPLYNPGLRVTLELFPDELFVGMDNQLEATHSFEGNHSNIKISKLGKKSIYPNNKFEFDFKIPVSYRDEFSKTKERELSNDVVPVIAHELTHSYQSYMEFLGGKEKVGFGREQILNSAFGNVKLEETPSWNNFVYLMYLHLSFEVNARVTQLYYEMKRKGVNDKKSAMEHLRKSNIWDTYSMLSSFDTEKFMREFKLDLPDDVEEDVTDFFMGLIMGGGPNDKPKSREKDEWYEYLIKKWDTTLQMAQQKFESLGLNAPIMDRVPEKAKKNPKLFFKFFENRFKKKAENFRRKMVRVVTLIVQESQEENNK